MYNEAGYTFYKILTGALVKILHAPWRLLFLPFIKRDKRGIEDCVFCTQCAENKDEEYFIIKRFKHCYVALNLYPYNLGHLLVLPKKHTGEFDELDKETRIEMNEVVYHSIKILKEYCAPQGFNIGINTGTAGGGAIPGHLHIHVLPRWVADTNFLPLIAETKVLSVDLPTLYKKMVVLFEKVTL